MEAKVIVNRWPLYLQIKNNSRYVRMDVLIDHEVVASLPCDLCGEPMRYEGYGRDVGWGTLYRHAFGICDNCQYAVSF